MLEDFIINLKLRKYKKYIIGNAFEFLNPFETFSVDYIINSYAVIYINGEIDFIPNGYTKTPYSYFAYKVRDELEKKGYKSLAFWNNCDLEDVKKLVKKVD